MPLRLSSPHRRSLQNTMHHCLSQSAVTTRMLPVSLSKIYPLSPQAVSVRLRAVCDRAVARSTSTCGSPPLQLSHSELEVLRAISPSTHQAGSWRAAPTLSNSRWPSQKIHTGNRGAERVQCRVNGPSRVGERWMYSEFPQEGPAPPQRSSRVY